MRFGAQRPAHHLLPEGVRSNAAAEAIDLAAAAGFALDDWQQWVLEGSCGERADGSWAAFECGLIVPRQNGKNGILMARELAGIVLFDDDLIIHSAHRADTTLEHFRNMVQLSEEFDELGRLVQRVSKVNGHEGIELRDGRRINFVSRARNPGRGFSGSMVVLDEAFNLSPTLIGAMIPVLATRGGKAQVWYTSSAPHADSQVLHGVRERGRLLTDELDRSLFYAEWSNEPDVDPDDLDAAYRANPALGIRITEDYVLRERRLMSAIPAEYLRERLGVAEQRKLAEGEKVIPLAWWNDCFDPNVTATSAPALAVDITPDRSFAAIVASMPVDGVELVEVVECREHGEWVVSRLRELARQHGAVAVAVHLGGPAGSLEKELREALGAKLRVISEREYVQACGDFYDAVRDRQVLHLDHDELRSALDGADKRVVGDAWKWDRRHSSVNIAPLVAATLARWASVNTPRRPIRKPGVLA